MSMNLSLPEESYDLGNFSLCEVVLHLRSEIRRIRAVFHKLYTRNILKGFSSAGKVYKYLKIDRLVDYVNRRGKVAANLLHKETGAYVNADEDNHP